MKRDNYGEYAKLMDLPLETEFYVVNGDFYAEILELDGKRYVKVIGKEIIRELKEADEAVIEIVEKDDDERDTAVIPY